jgi:hypothetical protein
MHCSYGVGAVFRRKNAFERVWMRRIANDADIDLADIALFLPELKGPG